MPRDLVSLRIPRFEAIIASVARGHATSRVTRSRLYAAPATIASISVLARPTNRVLAGPVTAFLQPISC
jgi:hypothetical protein